MIKRTAFALGLTMCWFPFHVTAEPERHSEFIFDPETWHNHGSCIVEAPNGELIVCWFHGSGERKADDVQILGARKKPGSARWSSPFVMADTPGFPDTNGCMMIDPDGQLWLFWPTILANRWETALMKYKVSREYSGLSGAPVWHREKVLHMKPGPEFETLVREKTAAWLSRRTVTPELVEWANFNYEQAADKLTRRLGWFTRAHPYMTAEGRIIVGLYSDGFSFSIATYSDDGGNNWTMSEPIMGEGNVQPSFARKRNGMLVAFMRDNGPAPYRVQVSESLDNGKTWTPAYDHPELLNPGSALELIALSDGRFLVVSNDTEEGRHQLAVSLSTDEGQTFQWTRHLESAEPGTAEFHYPSIIQSADGRLHCTYSYFVTDPVTGIETKTIKYSVFNLEWVEQGDL